MRAESGIRDQESGLARQDAGSGGNTVRFAARAVLAVLIGTASLAAQQAASPAITLQDLADGLKNPSRWLTYSGDYTGQRHSPLKQITPDNVHRLAAQWTFQAEGMVIGRGFESTPIVVDGTLYITGNNNYAWAYDARTGRQLWRYRRQLPAALTYGGGNPSNRGFAILGDRLFMTTLDAHLVALDKSSGKVLWDVVFDDYKVGHAGIIAPLIVKDKVIIGNSGGDLPTRGFIDAYDPATGARLWRFYTVPAPGEAGSETWSALDPVLPRGGGAAWVTGTYDPDLNLIYWGTGNPNADYYGDDRMGDNLYTASLVALDPDTGRLRWHRQFTPHDTHDWDSTHVPVLADLMIRGQLRKVVMIANRNGFFYTLDRTNGELIVGRPYTGTQWARELDAKGRPIVLNLGLVQEDGTDPAVCVPDFRGGTVFNPPSYDPSLQLFFVMARETCGVYSPRKQEPEPGKQFTGGGTRKLAEPDWGALRALDPKTGEMKWEYRLPTSSLAGVMSTASGVVFAGDNEGNFSAFDSRNGKRLWSYRTGSAVYGAAATTYMLDGRQYVLIPSGNTLTAFALPEK
jgi:alcohol dehydrogenase (cytochrome c)